MGLQGPPCRLRGRLSWGRRQWGRPRPWGRRGLAVGADYKVQVLSTVTAGSCHDSTAFMSSGLAALLAAAEGLLWGYLAAGDDAYIAGSRVLTPWPGHNLPWEKDSFNYYHSSSRTFAEQVFGQIVGRWGVLWRPISSSVSCAALIVRVCARLHDVLATWTTLVPHTPQYSETATNRSSIRQLLSGRRENRSRPAAALAAAPLVGPQARPVAPILCTVYATEV